MKHFKASCRKLYRTQKPNNMKNLLLLIGLAFCSLQFLNAQETLKPLNNFVENEQQIEAPSGNHTWVKGHWTYESGRYYWVEGAYIENAQNHTWVDGKWVKNQITDKYTYQDGFWNLEAEEVVHNGITYKPGVITQTSKIEIIQPIVLSSN